MLLFTLIINKNYFDSLGLLQSVQNVHKTKLFFIHTKLLYFINHVDLGSNIAYDNDTFYVLEILIGRVYSFDLIFRKLVSKYCDHFRFWLELEKIVVLQ